MAVPQAPDPTTAKRAMARIHISVGPPARAGDDQKDFFVRPQVELVRPGGAVLPVEEPVGVRDGLGREQAVIALRLDEPRRGRAQALAVDAAVDDDVRHVDALRAELARHALGDRASARPWPTRTR